jgi:hypothetical protein
MCVCKLFINFGSHQRQWVRCEGWFTIKVTVMKMMGIKGNSSFTIGIQLGISRSFQWDYITSCSIIYKVI